MNVMIDITAFDRATEPIVRILSPEQARRVAEYRATGELAARIEELSRKSTEGDLTEHERAEYAGYIHANKFVAILQAQARKALP